MTRKIRDYLRLQPILPKPQNVALLTKSDCLPVYLVNLPCSQNREDAEEFRMNRPDGREWVGRLLKRRRILSNSKNVECKRLRISNKLHTSLNFENHSNNLVCSRDRVNPEESDIYNANYGENVKSEDSSCEIGKSNTNIDVEHSVITKNVNNLSFPKTRNLAECSDTSDNGQSSLLSSFRQEEVENSIVDKSNPLLSAMDCKISKYEKTLETFVKISPCLPETVNKSRDFFTIKKSGKKKFVLCKKTVKKLLKFVPPNYCNNDRCCPNLMDVIKMGKGNNILKLENVNFNNNSLVQNMPEEKVAIDLNNNAKQFVKCDDDNVNHTTDNISENNKSIWTNVIPENQSNLWLDTNNLVDPGLTKGKITSNADNLNSESIQNTKYICREIIMTGTEEPECRHKLSPSGNLHPKTLAVLRKYRKIAPRTKQADEFKHCQTGVQSLNYLSSSKAKRSSCNKVHLQVEERAKSNKVGKSEVCFPNFKSCCEQIQQEKTSNNNKPYKIYSTFDARNCKKAIYSVDNSSKVALTDILDMKDQKSLQSLTFSELVKLSEKYGEKVFHSLSLDEITKKATTEIFDHNNVSNKLFNNYSKTNGSHKKTNITTKNVSFHGNASYETTGLNHFSCDIRGKSISETTCTSKPISGTGDTVNVCTLSFLQENNFDNTDTKSGLDYNKLITEDKCKFLKLLDLCRVGDKMAKIISVEPPRNKEILNLKNPLIPLHHLFKLAKTFRCKHKQVLYPKNKERLSSLGLTTGIASDDSKFRSISAGGNVFVSKNGHCRDEAWLLIPVQTTPRSSNLQERRGPAEDTSAITLSDTAAGRNLSAPFCSTRARSVISHCCTVSHHSKVSCSPSSTYHKLS
ncbi:uncharacterized protein [Centruroides vittatus]|uniref:uncharacterized protein n=1 Tax=Centruroides vittatus TaxID=120091 RepID=UPI0035108715